ncbi:MAG: hypothetical protein ACR2RA_08370 [Geminicoccaceae bacterium]
MTQHANETIRELNADELEQVGGGLSVVGNSDALRKANAKLRRNFLRNLRKRFLRGRPIPFRGR